MAKRLAEILSESFDTGGPGSHEKEKWYVRKIDRKHFGRFRWNGTKASFERKGGKYTDKREAENAAKLST